MTELTVRPLQKGLKQQGVVILDNETMQNFDEYSHGEYVKIHNNGKHALARTWISSDANPKPNSILMDAEYRENLDVNIGDTVTIEVAENVREAESVDVKIYTNTKAKATGRGSAQQQFSIRGDFEQFVADFLSARPITKGEEISFNLTPSEEPEGIIKIIDHKPSDCDGVLVDSKTSINVSRTSDNISSDQTHVTYEDIGGLEDELEQIREMIELPMKNPRLFQRLGINPPKGVLLHGPPGTGKTLIAKAVANEIDADFHSISGPEIMSKYYGESEEQLRKIFDEATRNSPSVIFMDELDSIATKREEATGDVEKRVVAQLLSLMDGLEDRSEVVVIGATNRIDALDPALRRGGRFDREIEVAAPDKEGRHEIFQVHTRMMPLADDIDLESYAEKTHGFVGADIEALCKEAAMLALKRLQPELDLDSYDQIPVNQLEMIEVTKEDMDHAMREVDPSALREVFVEIPDVEWTDIGGLSETKRRLQEIVQWPLNHADVYEDMSLDPAKGVLLYGPPGTGKTLLAKAVANESESNFISIKGPELLNKYVGESEKGVREVFDKARSNAPTVIFFDEIDALATERGSGSENNVGERVVSQLLTELDGLENLEDVVVIATTNRPDLIDSALLRPGRIDRQVYIREPTKDERQEVFEVHTRDIPLADDVNFEYLAEKTHGYVGADIEAVCREATMNATRDIIEHDDDSRVVTMEDFEHALEEVDPSMTDETREEYEEIKEEFEHNQVTQKDKTKTGFY